MKKIISIIIFVFLISGCATTGKPIKQTDIDQLQKGKTTKEEVINMFGEPNDISFTENNRKIFVYEAAKAKSTFWNFIPVVSAVHSGVKVKKQKLVIVFSKDNIVEEYSFAAADQPVTYGIIP